jgi:hypothetical protein
VFIDECGASKDMGRTFLIGAYTVLWYPLS